MTTYTRPGVFVNQSLTPLASSPSGVTGTALAVFVGAHPQGPVKPTLISSWQGFANLFGGFSGTTGTDLAYAVYTYFVNGGTGCYVYRIPNTDATVASTVIPSLEETSGSPNDATLLTLTAASPGAWGNQVYAEIVPQNPASAADSTVTFTLNVYSGGTSASNLVETWPAVSTNPSSPRNLVSLVNSTSGGSNYVSVATSFGAGGYAAGDGSSDPAPNSGAPVALAGGADGSTMPPLDTAVTAGISGTGWASPGLASLSNVVLNLNLPGVTSQGVLNNVIAWAQAAGNAMVIVDAPFGGLPLQSPGSLVSLYQQFLSGSGSVVNAQPCAVMYGPWLSVQDPASATPNATRWTAPGGSVLGLWAQNDVTRNVAQTPAGTQATVSAVALEAYFTPADLSNLETMQVNPVKLIPGAGFCVFGGRTMATGYPNRYINVARTLIQFTTDFVNITQFAIFENNDAALWQTITTVLTQYLTQAMQDGMLAGTTPATSYAVTCDATTTTPAQAQAGIVNAQVAVALVSPAEFVIINLSQMSSGATTTVTS